MTTKLRRGMALTSLVALASGLWACSLLVKRGETQCAVDGDCTALFGQGARCTADKVCSTTAGSDASGPSCTTNKECIAAAGGKPAICRKDTKACVTVTTPECAKVFTVSSEGKVVTDAAAVENDETVLVGSVTALFGANQLKGEARVNAMELALSEFAARGGVTVGGKSRPLAIVSCTDVDPPTDAGAPPADPAVVRSSRHLVSELGVQAIVGGGNSGTTTSALKEVTTKGSLLIAPSATSTGLTGNPDKNGLFFRTAPSDVYQGLLLTSVLKDVEPGASAPSKKLVILSKGDTYGQGLRDQIVDKLQWNGGKLSDSANSAVYKGIEYSAASGADLSTFVTQAITHQPAVVVIIGTNEGVDKLIKGIETGWTTGTRPLYVVSDGLKASGLADLVGASEATGLRVRVRGTAPGRRNSITDNLYLRYSSRFSAASNDSTAFGTAGAYDATYLILYALGGLGDAPITGSNLAAAVRKLTKAGAPSVDVGPNGIDSVRTAQRSNGDVHLNGSSSPLNFDDAGESPADIETWCLQKGSPPTFFTTAKYYSAAPPGIVGTVDALCTTP